jgi:polar amino acid transport system substrate-binding protein
VRRCGRSAAGFLILLAVATTTGCDSAGSTGGSLDSVEKGSLVVCTELPYAPFVVRDDDGEPTGFEIQLLERMADALELDLEVRPTPFAEIDDGEALRQGRCDVATGALTVTEQRRKRMSFADPHYDVVLTLLVPAASDVDGLSDLAGRRLAVQEDTSAEAYARRRAPSGTIIEPFTGDQEMVEALRAGRVDGVLQEQPVNLVHTETTRFTTVEQHRTGEQYAFAVGRDADRLQRLLNRELAALRADGGYQELYDTYFTAG